MGIGPHSSCFSFWATVCKTVRPMPSDRCLSSPVLAVCLSVCVSVCNVRALWPNGWMDQDQTWRAGRPRPWPHCVRWGPSPPLPKGGGFTPIFGHICCNQMAGWIKLPLGMEVGLGPGDIVLDGDPAPPKRAQPPIFGPCSTVAKWLDASGYHLVRR